MSERQLSSAKDVAYLISFEWDIQRNEVRRHSSTEPALTATPEESPGTFESVLRVVHPEDRQLFKANVDKALRHQGGEYENEYRIMRPDGEIVWLYERGRVARDPKGQPVRLIGLSQNITDRKQSEARQKFLVEAVSQLLVSDAPQAVIDTLCRKVMTFLDCQVFFNFLVDEQRGQLHLNACAGISEQEQARIEWLDFGEAVCGCAARDACRVVAEEVQTTSDPRTELVRSYGIRAYACHPLMAQGQVLGTLSFGTNTRERFSEDDLTLMKAVTDHVAVALERKRVMEALRESELFHRQTVDLIPGMVFTARADGYCDFQSQQWVDFTGVPMSEHLGDGWNALLHPDDRPRALAAWRNAVKGRSSYDLEYRVRRFDGEFEWFKVLGRPILNANGEIVRWLGTALNIDQLVKTREKLREAKVLAESATRAKSEFLANMSHEIRTPMTVFLMALEQLQQIDTDPACRTLLELADKSAKTLRQLVDDILDISKIEACRMKLIEGPFDPRLCLLEITEMFTLAARDKGLSLTTNVASDVPSTIVADQGRLKQVLINLVGNAIKFTVRGGVDVSVGSQDGSMVFSVADTGIGVPVEKQPLLFQSFSQVDNSFQRQYGGSGLGLAICKGLVELMGGTITMRSREEGGSHFSFTLPMKAAGAKRSAKIEPGDKRRSISSRPVRILLTDDDPLVRDVVALALTHHGWHVETAGNGREAIEKWQKEPFDVILMDLQMPDMNGLEAAGIIRSHEVKLDKRIAIIGFTAHTSEKTIERCIKAGMDYVLSKPLHFDDLTEVINQCLSD